VPPTTNTVTLVLIPTCAALAVGLKASVVLVKPSVTSLVTSLVSSGVGGAATGDQWQAARAAALVYLSPHPRLCFPVELLAGAAAGTVEHRLLDLGGLGGMRSLPPGEVIGNARLIARVEARWAAVHNAAIPLGVLWGNEIGLSGGLEAGGAWVDGKPVAAVGATAGIGWQVSLLGADPSYARVRVGFPLWSNGINLGAPNAVQVVLEGENLY
jgi:hypothetical protein